MKRLLAGLVILLLVLSACGNYEGMVTEKTEDSFSVEVPSDELEEEPVVHKMHMTDGTVLKGAIRSFEELEVGIKSVSFPLMFRIIFLEFFLQK